MQYAVVRLLLTIIDIYWWIVVASFIVSWLVAFDVINTRSSTVYSIRRALAALTEPLYEPIRRVIPRADCAPSRRAIEKGSDRFWA